MFGHVASCPPIGFDLQASCGCIIQISHLKGFSFFLSSSFFEMVEMVFMKTTFSRKSGTKKRKEKKGKKRGVFDALTNISFAAVSL